MVGGAPAQVARPARPTQERAKSRIRLSKKALEVMLDNMRFYHGEAEEVLSVLLAGDSNAADGDGSNQGIIDGIKGVLELRKRAGEEAARAAPYMHTRMGYDSGAANDDPDFVPLAERLKEYERRAKLAVAGDNVVELKGQDVQSDDPSRSELISPPIN